MCSGVGPWGLEFTAGNPKVETWRIYKLRSGISIFKGVTRWEPSCRVLGFSLIPGPGRWVR